MTGINFLSQRRKKLTVTQKRDRQIFRICMGILGGVLVFLVCVLGTRYWFSQRLASVRAMQVQARNQILGQESIERSYIISVNKITILAELFLDRQNKQQAITYFSSVFGDQVLVKQIAFAGDDQLLTFRLQAEDVFILEQVFDQLQSDEVKSRFAQVTPSDLRRSAEGDYEMTVAVTLGEDES
jgi:hypothetical protein